MLITDNMTQQIPTAFICPLSHILMDNPVIDHEGNTYDKIFIMQWLDINQTSPITRNELQKEWLTPNRALKNMIDEYKQKNNISNNSSTTLNFTNSNIIIPFKTKIKIPNNIDKKLLEMSFTNKISNYDLKTFIDLIEPTVINFVRETYNFHNVTILCKCVIGLDKYYTLMVNENMFEHMGCVYFVKHDELHNLTLYKIPNFVKINIENKKCDMSIKLASQNDLLFNMTIKEKSYFESYVYDNIIFIDNYIFEMSQSKLLSLGSNKIKFSFNDSFNKIYLIT